MSIKKALQISVLLAVCGAPFDIQCTPSNSDDPLMEWVMFFIEEAQKEESPLPQKAKLYVKDRAPRIIQFFKEQQIQKKEREKKWQAQEEEFQAREKARIEKYEADKKARDEHSAVMDQLRNEVQELRPVRYSSSISRCSWRQECVDCQNLVRYYKEYQQYSQALLLTERINSLQQQIEKHPNEHDLHIFLEKEKEQSSEELHQIPNWTKASEKQSYLEALAEDKKNELKTTMENLAKMNTPVGNLSNEYLALHDVFNKKLVKEKEEKLSKKEGWW